MASKSEAGFVLAGTLVALLAIALVLTALIEFSSRSVSQARRLETATQEEYVLHGAVTLIAAELATDPSQRKLAVGGAWQNATIREVELSVRVTFEAALLDARKAPLDTIGEALKRAGVTQEETSAIQSAIDVSRISSDPLAIEDLTRNSAMAQCLGTVLTVFDGQASPSPPQTDPIGRVARGAQLRVEVWAPSGRKDGSGRGRRAILQVTGQTQSPFATLDSLLLTRHPDEACRHV